MELNIKHDPIWLAFTPVLTEQKKIVILKRFKLEVQHSKGKYLLSILIEIKSPLCLTDIAIRFGLKGD